MRSLGPGEQAAGTIWLPVVVRASSAAQLQEDLCAAVALVRLKAVRGGQHGILVTQHSYTDFTVAISEDVPYGVTMEVRSTGAPWPPLRGAVDGRR